MKNPMAQAKEKLKKQTKESRYREWKLLAQSACSQRAEFDEIFYQQIIAAADLAQTCQGGKVKIIIF